MRLRSALPLVLLGLAVLIAAFVTGAAPEGPPLDPRSTGPAGTRALVDTLDELGADVRLGDEPRPDDSAALLLTDTLDDDRRNAVAAWVRQGGVLVVADPLSELAPDRAGVARDTGLAAPTLEAACDLGAARVAGTVQPNPGSAAFHTPEGAVGCFPADGGHWLVSVGDGQGARVALGGPEVLTNARLRAAGHAALGVGLLAPDPDTARVTVLVPPRPGEGDATLVELVPRNVWFALAQLGVAFLLVVAWRGRRLARPATEPQPVDLPASELVAATGNLLADARARRRAAALLRDDLRRELAERCGLPAHEPPDRLGEVLVARHGAARDDVARVLDSPSPGGDDELVAYARAVERLRRSVLGEGGPS